MTGTSAPEYHERTKHAPASVRSSEFSLDFENRPHPFKRYADRPTEPLADRLHPPQQPALSAVAEPAADPVAGTEQSPADLSATDLSTLCYYATGVVRTMGGPDERPTETSARLRSPADGLFLAASCTGKLYHVDCYLVCGEASGVPAGVYHFDPTTFSLDVLRRGDYRGVLNAATGGHPGVADAPVSVVTTSTWWRNAWKYRARTFRHAFWDSGTLLANLLAVAHGLDIRCEVVTGFADVAVADLVGVDPREEAPLEVVAVGRGDPAPDPPGSVDSIDHATVPDGSEPVDYPLNHEAWRAGALGDGDAVRAWRERVPDVPVGTSASGDGERFALDPVTHAGEAKTPLPLAVRRRRSCREYAQTDLSFRKVSTVLDRATRGAPLDVGVRAPDAPLGYVDAYLLVNGVASLPDGAYRYHVDDGELELLREGACREEAAHLALDQRHAGTPAVNVYFMADVDAVTDRLGDRGYRVAQLEAAIAGGRLYLATYAHRDLGGIGLTFYDDRVTEFLSPRAAGQTPMFLYVFGEAA